MKDMEMQPERSEDYYYNVLRDAYMVDQAQYLFPCLRPTSRNARKHGRVQDVDDDDDLVDYGSNDRKRFRSTYSSGFNSSSSSSRYNNDSSQISRSTTIRTHAIPQNPRDYDDRSYQQPTFQVNIPGSLLIPRMPRQTPSSIVSGGNILRRSFSDTTVSSYDRNRSSSSSHYHTGETPRSRIKYR